MRPDGAAYDPVIDAIFTERLLLRPFQAGDLPAFVAYRQDCAVARYQAWDLDHSMADAQRFLAELEGINPRRPGVWMQHAIVDRADGSLVGDCASHVLSEPPETAEVGVTVALGKQGRGSLVRRCERW